LSTILTFGQDKSPCQVTYTFELNTVNHMIDFNNKTVGHKVIKWSWDFGDGTISNTSDPKHVYMLEGTYVACLTIKTEDSCESVFCDTIIVGTPLLDTNSYYSISGDIWAGNVKLPHGVVLLMKRVNNKFIAQEYDVIDSINNGHYEFNQLAFGDYLVYAIPNFDLNVNYFPAYLPTYYGNSPQWENSTLLCLNSSFTHMNINLICNSTLLYGPDTITGSLNIFDQNSFEYNIYYSNWFGNIPVGQINFEKAPNIPILLLNNQNLPMRFTLTDENGNFRFINLPVSIYKIFPEKAGLTTYPATINMQTISGSSDNCSLYIGENHISIGINNPLYSELDKTIRIYPNPAHESVFISLTIEKPQSLTLSLEDITGKEVVEKERFISSGTENYFIPLSNLPSGVYLVKIQVEGMPFVVRKIIKQ
jgi:PKD repeat protein